MISDDFNVVSLIDHVHFTDILDSLVAASHHDCLVNLITASIDTCSLAWLFESQIFLILASINLHKWGIVAPIEAWMFT